MEEKYINIVKEAEALFGKIVKESSFIPKKTLFESYLCMHVERKITNVSLTNKT